MEAPTRRDTKRAHADSPWGKIVGMRHRLVQVYFDNDLPLVWATVRDDVPAPITLLELEPPVPPEAD